MNGDQWASLAERLLAQGLFGLAVAMAVFIFALHRGWIVLAAHFAAVVANNKALMELLHETEESAKATRDMLRDLLDQKEGRES